MRLPHRKAPAAQVPAPEPADSGAWLRPPEDAGYYWRCFSCGCLLALSNADAVVAEARAVIGDLTVVWCPSCLRQEAERIVDELGGVS